MDAEQVQIIRRTFVHIADAKTLARSLYRHLFEIAPETRSIFREGVDEQAERMARAMMAFVQHLDDPTTLAPMFERLAARHDSLGIEKDHFGPVGTALLRSLEEQLGEAWTTETEAAWRAAYDLLARNLGRRMWGGDDGRRPTHASDIAQVPPPPEGFDPDVAAELDYAGERCVRSTADRTLLQASLDHDIPHFHECGGAARCSTCRVEIAEGLERCSPRTGAEARLAKAKRFGDNIRLACQTRARGEVKLRRLLRDEMDVNAVLRGVTKTPGRELDLAIMFLDLRGFTPFTERHLAYDVVHILNRFFSAVGEGIHAHHGYIDKYMGDGLMALFGLDETRSEHACVDATHAAVAAHEALQKENVYFEEHFGQGLRFGIGIHYGPAIVGDIGYWRKQQLTALGDVVNGAARIEAATKATGDEILVSNAVREAVEAAVPGTFAFGASHDLELKGMSGLHRVHAVLAP